MRVALIVASLLGVGACERLASVAGEAKQAGRLAAELFERPQVAHAGVQQPLVLALDGCCGPPCGALCDRDALELVFIKQADHIGESAEACFICLVNAVAWCDGQLDGEVRAKDLAISERALDLLRLPGIRTDDDFETLRTGPIGVVE